MIYEMYIMAALRRWGPLGLMDLRRKVSGLIGSEAIMSQVKDECRILARRGQLDIETHKNGYTIFIRGFHEKTG